MRSRTRGACSAGFSPGAASRRTTPRGCRRCWTPRRGWPGRSSAPGWGRPGGAGRGPPGPRAGNFDPNELGGLAALTGNPVPGLARALARQVPQTAVSAVHRGATSQDIVDTAAMLLAKRAIDVIAADLARAADAAAGLATAHRDAIMIGRTLLQQAVPVTFGLVAAGWLTSLDDARAGRASLGPRLPD